MQTTGLKPEDVPALMDGVLRTNTAQTGRFDAYLPSPCIQNHVVGHRLCTADGEVSTPGGSACLLSNGGLIQCLAARAASSRLFRRHTR